MPVGPCTGVTPLTDSLTRSPASPRDPFFSRAPPLSQEGATGDAFFIILQGAFECRVRAAGAAAPPPVGDSAPQVGGPLYLGQIYPYLSALRPSPLGYGGPRMLPPVSRSYSLC